MKIAKCKINDLYVAYRTDSRLNAKTISAALLEAGIQHEFKREDQGYASQVGRNGKRPDTLSIELEGYRYGSGKYESRSLQRLLDIIFDFDGSKPQFTEQQTIAMELYYHEKMVAEHEKVVTSLRDKLDKFIRGNL